MTIRHIAIGLASFLGVAALSGGSAQALTMKECSAKYKAAQTAGTLNGAKWNDFRKTECAANARPRRRHPPRARRRGKAGCRPEARRCGAGSAHDGARAASTRRFRQPSRQILQ